MCAIAPTTGSDLGQAQPCVLCVDDSQEILEINQTILQAAGYQVLTATCGEAALKVLQLRSVDVAIIDNVMPGMNGSDLARRIKSSAPGILVVMYSGTIRENPSLPFVDACLYKGKGPLALRDLLGVLLHK